MDRLIYTAMTGAKHAMAQQATTANNLANINTTGFRAQLDSFRAVQVQGEGLPTRAFVVDSTVGADFRPGVIQQTGRELDVALQSQGWLVVQAADGSEAYTRNGSFELNVNGIIQTRSGIPVQGDGGPISVPPEVTLSIGSDGTISALPETGPRNTPSVIGRIKLVKPPNGEMIRGEDGLFRVRGGDPATVDETVGILSGTLEGSNVNAAEQMVTMISLARQFEMQMKMLSTADANDRAATQILASR